MIFFYFLIWIMPYDRHPIWDMQIAGLTLFYYVGAVCAIRFARAISSLPTNDGPGFVTRRRR